MYADSTAVLGPLATQAEPHSYDLCELHAKRLTAPRGWEIVHLVAPEARPVVDEESLIQPVPRATPDDLTSVVDAVLDPPRPRHKAPEPAVQVSEVSRRGHLRMLRGESV
ncbi:hypothetical protein GCM10010401_03340 [Rarobacter faecitabidus]